MKRLSELDVMRAFAIVGVVFLHAYFNTSADVPRLEMTGMHALHLLAHTGVPVFLFASGYLLAREDAVSAGQFWAHKATKIFGPALVMMAGIAVFRVVAFDWEWRWAWDAFVRFDVSGQYYYIFVLLILYASFRMFVRPLPGMAVHGITAVLIAAGLAMVAWYEANPVGGDAGVWAYRNPLIWAGFYASGYSLARAGLPILLPRNVVAIATAVAAIAAVAFFVQGEVLGSYPRSYFGVSVFVFSSAMLLIYPHLAAKLVEVAPLTASITRRLSRYTLGIFFIHAPFFIGYLDHKVGAWPDDYLLHMFALATFAFLGSLSVLILLDRLTPPGLTGIAGIDRRRPRVRAMVPGYQASTDARFLPSRGGDGRIERRSVASQNRDSAGSMASSIPK